MECLEEEQDLRRLYEELQQYHFDFENLAFEGGGAKMASYVGVIQVLQGLGVLARCRRFVGTSGGSIIAACLAIRLNYQEIRHLMRMQFREMLIDSRYGAMSMIPNIMKKFGWNPAQRFHDHIKAIFREKTGNENITFREVHRRFKTSLCIVATNVSTMSVEYFHPKTTPDIPVAVAIRASMALPGYIQPVKYVNEAGLTEFYCDGGLVCNFPLHCFDGWYLSMKTEDSFFNKLGEDEPPFDSFNPKTLGFLLYTAWEGEFMQGELHTRFKDHVIKRPHTPLAKSRKEKCDAILEENMRTHDMVQAGKRFLHTLREVDVDHDGEISLEEFKTAFDKLQIKPSDVELLFGQDFTFDKAFQEIDKDTNGKITFDEFLWYMQKKGIRFRALLEGGNMMQIDTFSTFFEVTFNTVLNMTRKAYYKSEDSLRTVGIYTDYVDTTDFALCDEDKDFMIRQGVIACLVYFQDLKEKRSCGTLPKCMKGSVRERTEAEKLEEWQKMKNTETEQLVGEIKTGKDVDIKKIGVSIVDSSDNTANGTATQEGDVSGGFIQKGIKLFKKNKQN